MDIKKILIVTPFFVPAYSYGGIVKVAFDQAVGLKKKGFQVTVVTTDVFDSKKRTEILNENIEGIEIIRFKNLSNYLAKFQNLYLPKGMKNWFKNNIQNYDIVHIHDIYNLPTYYAIKFANEKGIRYFIQPHGTLSNIRIDSRKSFIKKWILNKFKKYFDTAVGWFALTQNEILEIKNITNNPNIFELPNGLYLDKFKNIQKFDIHNKYNLSKDTKIITFLGRIQYIKGLDISFEILKQLNKDFKNWRFLIIGPDEGEKQNLINLSKKLGIENNIIWYGLENTNKKYELLKGSDLFLFNSRSEGFPMTVLESIACELPVIISDGCNLGNIGKCNAGKVVNNNHIKKIVENIKIIFENHGKFVKGGKDLLYKNYDIDLIINNLIQYYIGNKK